MPFLGSNDCLSGVPAKLLACLARLSADSAMLMLSGMVFTLGTADAASDGTSLQHDTKGGFVTAGTTGRQ